MYICIYAYIYIYIHIYIYIYVHIHTVLSLLCPGEIVRVSGPFSELLVFLKLTRTDPFAGDRGCATGRDTRRAVGSWSH